jgi:hypothetical protein
MREDTTKSPQRQAWRAFLAGFGYKNFRLAIGCYRPPPQPFHRPYLYLHCPTVSHRAMPVPITSFSQLDPNKSYTYADYMTWKFDTFVELIRGKLQSPMAGPTRMHQVYFGNIFGEVQRFLTLPRSMCA